MLVLAIVAKDITLLCLSLFLSNLLILRTCSFDRYACTNWIFEHESVSPRSLDESVFGSSNSVENITTLNYISADKTTSDGKGHLSISESIGLPLSCVPHCCIH